MKQFVVLTTSESSDHYTYLIEHPKKPTEEELERFLAEHANDIDEEDGEVYEQVDEVIEIKNFLRIPEEK